MRQGDLHWLRNSSGATCAEVEDSRAALGLCDELDPEVAEAPWSVAEWAVALRFDNPRATVLVLVSG